MGVKTETTAPQSIKGYKILERLQAGGFGVVYRGKQSSAFGREVAIKVILPKYANQPEFIRRFEAEAELIARLEHPHIVPLYDYWRDPNGAYLVMRYLRGGSVQDVLQSQAYGLEATSQLLNQVASALEFAHRSQVVHRDIKPGNILLDEDGRAYVADFGIAKDLLKEDSHHTAPESIVGSLDYISPEQARSEPVTTRTDIYSLGVTLYEMITGEHPFERSSSVERLYKHINDPLPDIAELEDDVRDEINACIQKATAKNPVERYSDVLSFAKAFREAANLDATAPGLRIIEQLTLKEHEFLQHLVDGLSIREIAEQMFIAPSTAKFHRKNVYKKLGIRTRVQAIIRARELDLIFTEEFDGGKKSEHILPPILENPYKGLHAFQSADAQDFFGREKLIECLLLRMQEGHDFQRFLAIIGPSGSGKSSVVKAGLIPALHRGDIEGSERWYIVDVLPGDHPLEKLEIALTRVANEQAENINQHLQRDERGLLRIADLILPQDGTELLIYIDQFEEVFTQCEDENERQALLNLLYTAVTAKRSRVRVIVTLRADYYDKPLHYQEFGEMLRSRMETLLPLGAKSLERAIVGPAERVGVSYEKGLVAQIVSEMTYQASALPLLQYALTELFNQREERLLTHKAYQEIGGAVGALANRAEELYQELDEDGHELAKQMFLRLVTLGEGAEDTRRRVTFSEILSLTENSDLMEEIIDAFADYRLLSLDRDEETRQPTAEVAHEAILREWKRLREWLTECRDDIRQERQLAQATSLWETAKRDQSYLLTGGRLKSFEDWVAQTDMQLTPLEKTFIETSTAEREILKKAELKQERLVRNMLIGLVAVLTIGVIVSTGFGFFALTQRNTALREAEVNHSLVLASDAEQLYANGETDLSLMLAIAALDIDEPPEESERIFTEIATGPGLQAIIPAHDSSILDIAIHPQAPNLAVTAGCAELSADNVCSQGALYLWDIDTGQQLRQFVGHNDWVNAIRFSPDGVNLLSASDDGLLILWDVETGEILQTWDAHTEAITSVAMNTDGTMALSGSKDDTLILWNVSDGQVIARLEGHADDVTIVRISPDGLTALSGSQDSNIILWDINPESPNFGETLQRMEGHQAKINDVNYVPNAGFAPITAVSASQDFSLRMWNLETGEQIREHVTGNPPWFTEMASDGVSMIINEGKSIHIWNIANWHFVQRLHSPSAQGESLTALTVSIDNSHILTGNEDGSVHIWTMGASARINNYQREGGHMGIYFVPDSDLVISGSWFGGEAWLWNMNTEEVIQRYPSGLPLVLVEVNPNDRQLIVTGMSYGSKDRSFALWDIESGEKLFDLEGEHAYWPRDVEFTPDGSAVLIGTQTFGTVWEEGGVGDLILWDTTTGEMIRRFDTQDDVTGIAFRADGQQVLTASSNGSAGITRWDVNTGQVLQTYPESSNIYDVILVYDDTQFITAGDDGSVLLWDVESGEILRRFTAHERKVWDLEISPDEQLMLTTDEGGVVILWDLQTGQVLRRFTEHSASGFYTHFSPDGQTAFSTHIDGTLIEWRIEAQFVEELMTWVEDGNRYIRDFTCEEQEQYRIEPYCEEEQG